MNTTINIQELNNYNVLDTNEVEENNKPKTTKETVAANIKNLEKAINLALDLVELQHIPELSKQLLKTIEYFENNYS